MIHPAIIAAISGEGLVGVIITLIVAGLIYWLLDWLITKVALPDPFAKVARVILIVAAVLFVINALLSLTGHPIVKW